MIICASSVYVRTEEGMTVAGGKETMEKRAVKQKDTEVK